MDSSIHKASVYRPILVLLAVLLCLAYGNAQMSQGASHMVPTGKGWAAEAAAPSGHATPTGGTCTTCGINYNGGPIMSGNVNVYFIWYGNWNGSGNNTATTVNQLTALFGGTGALGGSGYEKINTTYADTVNVVTGNLAHAGTDQYPGYSNGTKLRDTSIKQITTNYINQMQGGVPDPNGLYFVLTSSDVNETSGFCTKYCGWHTHASINGVDVKYSFVGNPDRCPSGCEAESTAPSGDSAANGMASIMAHESEEAISDPDLNAWYDSSGAENADKCAWKFGPKSTASNGSTYNQTLGGYQWLIQMNWENMSGGGCAQTYGGAFYTN